MELTDTLKMGTMVATSDQIAHQRCITNILTRYYTDKYSADPELLREHAPHLADYLQEVGSKAPSYDCRYLHVTLNFPSKMTYGPDDIVEHLNKRQPSFVKRWIGVIERYTAKGEHTHVHMLIEKQDINCQRPESGQMRSNDRSPAQVAQAYHRSFVNKTGITKEAIHVKKYQDPSPVLQYILGTKTDPAKAQGMALDREWRDDYRIPHVLGNWGELATPVLVNCPILPSGPVAVQPSQSGTTSDIEDN